MTGPPPAVRQHGASSPPARPSCPSEGTPRGRHHYAGGGAQPAAAPASAVDQLHAGRARRPCHGTARRSPRARRGTRSSAPSCRPALPGSAVGLGTGASPAPPLTMGTSTGERRARSWAGSRRAGCPDACRGRGSSPPVAGGGSQVGPQRSPFSTPARRRPGRRSTAPLRQDGREQQRRDGDDRHARRCAWPCSAVAMHPRHGGGCCRGATTLRPRPRATLLSRHIMRGREVRRGVRSRSEWASTRSGEGLAAAAHADQPSEALAGGDARPQPVAGRLASTAGTRHRPRRGVVRRHSRRRARRALRPGTSRRDHGLCASALLVTIDSAGANAGRHLET